MKTILHVFVCLSFLLLGSCKRHIDLATKTASQLNFIKDWSSLNGGSSSDHYWSGTATLMAATSP